MKKQVVTTFLKLFLAVAFFIPTARAQTVSVWPVSAVPANTTSTDSASLELGMSFTSSVAGTVTGIRFFKGAGNGGIHIGNLWTSSGVKLAAGTFANETASGWQTLTFGSPVLIQANTLYVVSYHAPQGHYPYNSNFFAGPLIVAPLTATGSVYLYGTGSFPSQTYNKSNYWVDLLFLPSSSSPPPSTISGIAVTCQPGSLSIVGQTSQCSDVVSGTGPFSNIVAWSTSDGAISVGGLLTPSGRVSSTIVTATSAQTPAIIGTSTVNFVLATIPPACTSIRLTITGSNIAPGATVNFGSVAMTVTDNTVSQLTGTLPCSAATITNPVNGVQHVAGLSWNAPADVSGVTVVSYNVYRGVVTGGPYTFVTGVNPGVSYTDNTVVSGQTYYYVITTVGANGSESVFSNEVKATVPQP